MRVATAAGMKETSALLAEEISARKSESRRREVSRFHVHAVSAIGVRADGSSEFTRLNGVRRYRCSESAEFRRSKFGKSRVRI